MPNWAGHSPKREDYRFLAIREPLRQLPLGDAAQPPFPTQEFASKGTYKLFGMVNQPQRRGRPGDLVAARAVRQERGSPFGDKERPCRRATAIPPARRQRRILGLDEALHFRLIGLPGRVANHARKLIIRLGAGADALATIVNARQAIRMLARGPAG